MELIYRSCRMLTIPELNLDADCWIPKVDVSWEEQGAPRHQLLTGPSDIFKIIDEAEVYAIEMAKAWIDVEFVTADPKTSYQQNRPKEEIGGTYG